MTLTMSMADSNDSTLAKHTHAPVENRNTVVVNLFAGILVLFEGDLYKYF
jgi:hypothetical protein